MAGDDSVRARGRAGGVPVLRRAEHEGVILAVHGARRGAHRALQHAQGRHAAVRRRALRGQVITAVCRDVSEL